MKRLSFFLTLLLLSVSCVRDNTKELRENFQTIQTCGICDKDAMVLSIDMSEYQYMCSPSKGIYRFTDESGTKDLTLTLTGAALSESGSVQGVISGTLGQNGMKFKDLYILKKSSSQVWLWSDADKRGIILPAWGTVNR